MIKLTDSLILARTKLRSHRIRTGIMVGISGLLFGLIIFVIIFTQGVLSSVDKYNHFGLNNRNILAMNAYNNSYFAVYDHLGDQDFIKEIEKAQKDLVAKKTAAAKKYSIQYDPATENPSPIVTDSKTKIKTISEAGISSEVVMKITQKKQLDLQTPIDINEYIGKYKSASIVSSFNGMASESGSLEHMKNGKEKFVLNADSSMDANNSMMSGYFFTKMNQSLSEPLITNKSYDPSKGDIPVIVTYSMAVKALGLKSLDKNASNEDRLNRLKEVHARIGEVAIPFCYRNEASSTLLKTAIAQRDEIKSNINNKDYLKPSVIYKLPAESDCGPVTIEKDTRTAEQKKQAANQILYEKEIGTYSGEPFQQKIIARGVGVSSDAFGSSSSSVSGLVGGLLSSNLGYNSGLVVPEEMFAKVPAAARPEAVFGSQNEDLLISGLGTTLVEFKDKSDARAFIKDHGEGFTDGNVQIISIPFGSNTLLVDEAKSGVSKGIFWAVIVVGAIAVIILAGVIGRTISEGRKESAVFRAIGAKRVDIASIYGLYALLLSIRVALFSLVLSFSVAFVVDFIISKEATVGAKFAYSAPNSNIEFHFLGIDWTILIIIGIIIVVGLFSAIGPIIMNARRNPIRDMREE